MAKKLDPEREREYREEAERLALFPVEMQRQLIAEQRAISRNPKAPRADRDYARERANALQRHLFPRIKKKGGNL
jgi:hypothetical protein